MLFLNLLLLLAASVIPFPTAVLGQWITDTPDASVAAAFLGAVYVLMGLAFGSIWVYAVRRHDVTMVALRPSAARLAILCFTIGSVAYLVGIGVAFLNPLVSLLLYGLVALYYVFPTLPAARSPHELG